MSTRVCKCCGQPIQEEADPLSRNPNICTACSALAQGTEEPSQSQPGVASAPPPVSDAGDSDDVRAAA